VFTGIVREKGRVAAIERSGGQARLSIEAPISFSELAAGDSLAVDGCCLTAVEKAGATLTFDVSPETLSRTTLGSLSVGDDVNLEPALTVGAPLGGHYVQGHVDGVGQVREVVPEGDGVRMWIGIPPDVLRYCAEKGSLAVSGVSLTIASLADDAVAVALIPYTLERTTLGDATPGDRLNLEADVLAKYVERLVGGRARDKEAG
jgi:riboflavin synthase